MNATDRRPRFLIWYLVGGQMLGSIEHDDQGRPFTRRSATAYTQARNRRARKGETYTVRQH